MCARTTFLIHTHLCTTTQHKSINQNRVRNDIRIYVRGQRTYTRAMRYNLGSKRRNRVPGRGVTLRAGRGEGDKVKHWSREMERKKGEREREDTIHNEAGYNKEADEWD